MFLKSHETDSCPWIDFAPSEAVGHVLLDIRMIRKRDRPLGFVFHGLPANGTVGIGLGGSSVTETGPIIYFVFPSVPLSPIIRPLTKSLLIWWEAIREWWGWAPNQARQRTRRDSERETLFWKWTAYPSIRLGKSSGPLLPPRLSMSSSGSIGLFRPSSLRYFPPLIRNYCNSSFEFSFFQQVEAHDAKNVIKTGIMNKEFEYAL